MDELLCSLSGQPLFAAFRRARAGPKVKGSTDDSELICTKTEKYLTHTAGNPRDPLSNPGSLHPTRCTPERGFTHQRYVESS